MFAPAFVSIKQHFGAKKKCGWIFIVRRCKTFEKPERIVLLHFFEDENGFKSVWLFIGRCFFVMPFAFEFRSAEYETDLLEFGFSKAKFIGSILDIIRQSYLKCGIRLSLTRNCNSIFNWWSLQILSGC